MKGIVSVLLLIGVLAITACGGQVAETPQPDMPNPASAFCEEQGYELEIRTAADGSQQGFCLFPDGGECEEWAFFRGECGPAQDAAGAGLPNPAAAFCEEQGYKLEIRTAADGSQQGFCRFPDGSECDEWAFFRGECGPATPEP
jgi:putative hemolysin